MNKRLLTYLLLFAFAVVLSPRSIWHSHDDNGRKACVQDDDHDHSDTDEDCYVCDFTLQPALSPVSFQFRFTPFNAYIAPATAVPLGDVQEISVHCLRGPPALIS